METCLPLFQPCRLTLWPVPVRSSAESRSTPGFSAKLCLYTLSSFCLDCSSRSLSPDIPTAPSKGSFTVPHLESPSQHPSPFHGGPFPPLPCHCVIVDCLNVCLLCKTLGGEEYCFIYLFHLISSPFSILSTASSIESWLNKQSLGSRKEEENQEQRLLKNPPNWPGPTFLGWKILKESIYTALQSLMVITYFGVLTPVCVQT